MYLQRRQRIGGGAVKDKVDIAVGIKKRAQAIRGPLSPDVLTIGWLVRPVGFGHGGPDLRANTTVIVTGKLLKLRHNYAPEIMVRLADSPLHCTVLTITPVAPTPETLIKQANDVLKK
jgi:hypothetical protein